MASLTIPVNKLVRDSESLPWIRMHSWPLGHEIHKLCYGSSALRPEGPKDAACCGGPVPLPIFVLGPQLKASRFSSLLSLLFAMGRLPALPTDPSLGEVVGMVTRHVETAAFVFFPSPVLAPFSS